MIRLSKMMLILLLAAWSTSGDAKRQISSRAIFVGRSFEALSEAEFREAGAKVLFWSQAERDANFPHMEQLFPAHMIKAGATVRRLPTGKPLPIPDAEVDALIRDANVAGVIVLDHGRVRLERYARGLG